MTTDPAQQHGIKGNLEILFKMIADDPLPDDFLSEPTRRNEPARNPFEEWAEDAPPSSTQFSESPHSETEMTL